MHDDYRGKYIYEVVTEEEVVYLIASQIFASMLLLFILCTMILWKQKLYLKLMRKETNMERSMETRVAFFG